MPVQSPMKDLYAKLASFGMPRAWVRKNLLPSWWDDEVAQSAAGFAEALLHVARTSGLDLASLGAVQDRAVATPAAVRFKRRSTVDVGDLEVVKTLACQLARTVAVASRDASPGTGSALELREQLLENRSWIDLETLVGHCWSVGIPVLQMTNFPTGARKPDALAVDAGGRKVIILTTARTSAPWLLFLVAHELGHIACGHLSVDSALVDAKVDRDDDDVEEAEATAWAITLLSGKPDTAFRATSTWLNATQLAQEAEDLANRLQTDPGFIVLNYAHSMGNKFFAVANAALSRMPRSAGGDAVIRRLVGEQLDWSRLGEDAAEYISRMIGTSDDETASALAP